MNNQEKYLLPIVESFYTIQGEGFNTGFASYFIRIAGCDVCCNFCDSKSSWNKNDAQLVDIREIIKEIINLEVKMVVITGGEPLSNNLDFLCNKLKNNNITTLLETSGTENISGTWDWICFSPKKNTDIKQNIISLADELKVVVKDKSDFEFAEIFANKVNEKCKLFLQPEWSKKDNIIPIIIDFIKKNNKWRLSLQTHKFIGIK